jgi:hypothetical protein
MSKHPERRLRIHDLEPAEVIEVVCLCQRIVNLTAATLFRLHRIPSDTLIYDLQFLLKCGRCGRRDDFKIAVVDLTDRHKPGVAHPRKVIVP